MTKKQDNKGLLQDSDLFEYMSEKRFGNIYIKHDRHTGLKAIIAIHSNKLGPALGGCRFLNYNSTQDALLDALKLSRAMSFKAAMVDIPFGGGKAVLINSDSIKDREKHFKAYGKFLDTINGKYITAVDSGTNLDDMEHIASQTPYVASRKHWNGSPSPYTALGVFKGIISTIKRVYNKDSAAGLHVAIQGVGAVGNPLCKLLLDDGAKVTVTDVNKESIEKCVKDYNVKAVEPDDIFGVDCDIFSPCALGAIINDETIPRLKAKIIAGAANNQLATQKHGKILHEAGILYAPDYVINAGGLIYAAAKYRDLGDSEIQDSINNIYNSLTNIFNEEDKQNRPTNEIADEIAISKLKE